MPAAADQEAWCRGSPSALWGGTSISTCTPFSRTMRPTKKDDLSLPARHSLARKAARSSGVNSGRLKLGRVHAIWNHVHLRPGRVQGMFAFALHKLGADNHPPGFVLQVPFDRVDVLLGRPVNTVVAAILRRMNRGDQGQMKLVLQCGRRKMCQPVMRVQQKRRGCVLSPAVQGSAPRPVTSMASLRS